MVFSGDFPERVFCQPFKGIKRVRGAPPGTKTQGGHVKVFFSGLLTQALGPTAIPRELLSSS